MIDRLLEKKVFEYLDGQTRFSPLSVSDDLNLVLRDSVLACEKYQESNQGIDKYFRITCNECDEYITGFHERDLGEVESATCQDCGNVVKVCSDVMSYYYVKSLSQGSKGGLEKSQSKGISTSNDGLLFTPVLQSSWIDKTPDKAFFQNTDCYLWQISDLHFSDNPGFFGHGHCDLLKGKFLQFLKLRKNIDRDLFVINGDCTDDGSENSEKLFYSFVKDLIKIGVSKENILAIPGNHDAWNGSRRPMLALRGYTRSEGRLLKKYRPYPFRELPSIFENFNNTPMHPILKKINEIDVQFLLINSTIPGELARGVFPINIPDFSGPGQALNIAVIHHHLIDDLNRTNLGGIKNINKMWMRVLNAGQAFTYLYKNKIKISLHGHKHLQYFKKENALNCDEEKINLISAPSLFENSYDEIEGEVKGNNFIGFNVLNLKKSNFDLYFFRLRKNDYVTEHHQRVKYE